MRATACRICELPKPWGPNGEQPDGWHGALCPKHAKRDGTRRVAECRERKAKRRDDLQRYYDEAKEHGPLARSDMPALLGLRFARDMAEGKPLGPTMEAVEKYGGVETDVGDLEGEDLFTAIAAIVPSEMRSVVMGAVRESVAMWRRANAGRA